MKWHVLILAATCYWLYTRHYTPLRLIPVCLILIAGLTSFVICLPEGSQSQCEKLIFCRRISSGVIAIGLHYITMIHSTSVHRSRLNKVFISCCIRQIFYRNMQRHTADCSLYCQGSGRRYMGIAMHNLKLCFRSSDSLSREINNLF